MATVLGASEDFCICKEVSQLLKNYPELRVDRDKQKVCCCLTGHEMQPRVDAILSYVKGKKFQRAQKNREFDYDAYKPHLVPSKKTRDKGKLFCMLTLRHVTRQPADVERHVKGKRYQRALQRWQKCQETGEVFKPRGPKKRRDDDDDDDNSHRSKHKEFWETDSEGEEGADEDNLSDLYPSEDFASEEEGSEANDENQVTPADGGSGSDFDFEDMDVSVKPVNGTGDMKAKSQKRKKKQKGGGKKIKKS